MGKICSAWTMMLFFATIAWSGPVSNALKELSEYERNRYKFEKAKIRELYRGVERAFVCETCEGRGFKDVEILVRSRTRNAFFTDRTVPCKQCKGDRVRPAPEFGRTLNAYYAKCRSFEQEFPFAAPLKTGIEAALLRNVKASACYRWLNPHFAEDLSNPQEGHVTITGFQVHRVEHVDEWAVARCISFGAKTSVTILFQGKVKWNPGTTLAVVARRDRELYYCNELGIELAPRHFTAVRWKQLGFSPLMSVGARGLVNRASRDPKALCQLAKSKDRAAAFIAMEGKTIKWTGTVVEKKLPDSSPYQVEVRSGDVVAFCDLAGKDDPAVWDDISVGTKVVVSGRINDLGDTVDCCVSVLVSKAVLEEPRHKRR